MRSWVESANEAECGFPLENLPFCAFRVEGMQMHLGIGIGDQVFDLNLLSRTGLLRSAPWKLRSVCRSTHLNALMNCGSGLRHELRKTLTILLSDDLKPEEREKAVACLRPMAGTKFEVPVKIGDYTDFYASVHHATTVGKLFRPDNPLLPNYKWVPIGYHGRASSIVVSGTPVSRPCGQRKRPDEDLPSFGPSGQMDYELELGVYIGFGNPLGIPIPIEKADERIFGCTLLNDWSARDIQAWEYQPLGPFLGKSFATTVSPWVVTMEALEPYRAALEARAEDDPQPLEYLRAMDTERQGIDVRLEVYLMSERMRAERMPGMKLSSVRATELYWSFAQMVAHHSSNGCNLRTGDLLASGTISGPRAGEQGCLLEITKRGAEPLRLPTGEARSFLEDGDEVTFAGYCQREGLPRIALGECTGRLVPATLAGRGIE